MAIGKRLITVLNKMKVLKDKNQWKNNRM